jgi:chromosome segregation ATPase
MKTMEDEVYQSKNRIEELTSEYSKLSQVLEDAQISLQTKEQEVNHLNKENGDLDAQLKDAGQEVDKLQGDVSNIKEQLKEAVRERDRLERQLETEKSEIEGQWHKEIRELTEKLEEQETQVRDIEDSRQQLNNQLSSLQFQFAITEKQSAENEQENLTLKQTISDLQLRVDDLQQSLQEKGDSVSLIKIDLEAQLSLLSAESSSLQSDLEAALSAKQNAENELRQITVQLTKEIDKNQQERSTQDSATLELKNEMKTMEDEVYQCKNRIEELRSECSKLSQELEDAQISLQTKEQEVNHLTSQLTETSTAKETIADEKDNTIAKLQERLTAMEQTDVELKAARKDYQMKIQDMTSEICHLRDQTETAVFLKDELSAQKENLEETVEKLKDQLVVMETDLIRNREISDGIAKEREQISHEVEELQRQLAFQEADAGNRMALLNETIADIKQHLNSLENVLAEKEVSIKQLESWKDTGRVDLENKLKEAQDHCHSLHSDMSSKENAVHELEELVGEMKKEQAEYVREKLEQDGVIADLRERLTSLQTAFGEQEDGRRHAEKQFRSVRWELEDEIRSLKEALTVESQKALEVKNQLEENRSLQMTVKKLEKSLTELEVTLCKEKEKQEELETIRSSLEGQIEMAVDESARLSAKLQSTVSMLEDITREKEERDERIAEMATKISVLENEKADWQEDQIRLDSEKKEPDVMISCQKVEFQELDVQLSEKVNVNEESMGSDDLDGGMSGLNEKEAETQKKQQHTQLPVRATAYKPQSIQPDPATATATALSKQRLAPLVERRPGPGTPRARRYKLRSSQKIETGLPQRTTQRNQKASRNEQLVQASPGAPRTRFYQLRSSQQVETGLPQRSNQRNQMVSRNEQLDQGSNSKSVLKNGVRRLGRTQTKTVHWKDQLQENLVSASQTPTSLHSVRMISPSPLKASNSLEPKSPLLQDQLEDMTCQKSPKRTLFSKAKRDPQGPLTPAKRVKSQHCETKLPTPQKASFIDMKDRPECKVQ